MTQGNQDVQHPWWWCHPIAACTLHCSYKIFGCLHLLLLYGCIEFCFRRWWHLHVSAANDQFRVRLFGPDTSARPCAVPASGARTFGDHHAWSPCSIRPPVICSITAHPTAGCCPLAAKHCSHWSATTSPACKHWDCCGVETGCSVRWHAADTNGAACHTFV